MKTLTVEALKTFPAFHGISDITLSAMAADCSLHRYAAGELVIGHTDTSLDVLLVMSGTAQVSLYSQDGQRVGFREMGRGMIFGEISAIDGGPRSAGVEASEDCLIARLPHKRFIALVGQDPALAMAIARQLAAHVRRLTTRVFEFSTMAVRQRLRAELLRLAGPRTPGQPSALIPNLPTHAEIASRISTHREAVSREMAWLESKGFTVKQGRNLLIPDLDAVQKLLDDSWQG